MVEKEKGGKKSNKEDVEMKENKRRVRTVKKEKVREGGTVRRK